MSDDYLRMLTYFYDSREANTFLENSMAIMGGQRQGTKLHFSASYEQQEATPQLLRDLWEMN